VSWDGTEEGKVAARKRAWELAVKENPDAKHPGRSTFDFMADEVWGKGDEKRYDTKPKE
jgi:hypothetical protein